MKLLVQISWNGSLPNADKPRSNFRRVEPLVYAAASRSDFIAAACDSFRP